MQIEREKKGAEYHKYVEDLLEYLSSFYKRTRPLADINDVIRPANEVLVVLKWCLVGTGGTQVVPKGYWWCSRGA